MRQMEQIEPGEDVQLLDSSGCLTPEAMCFTEQLGLYQQGVVERHIQSCPSCAQQMVQVRLASQRFREVRPRIPVPVEIKLLGRQVAMRSPVLASSAQAARRGSPRQTARLPQVARKNPLVLITILLSAVVVACGLTLILLFR
jgi:hypothetical protein